MPKTKPKTTPYGSWKSPVSAEMAFAGANRLSQPQIYGQMLYWIEERAAEAGRRVIMRRTPDGKIEDCIPTGFNARTRVHEYGGGDYIVIDGMVYFANYRDQRVYACPPGGEPRPLTPVSEPAGALRYADFTFDHCSSRLICVGEDHRDPHNVVNSLVSIGLEAQGVETLVQGADFYAAPRMSTDGEHIAWLTWDHPNMPWDGCELWAADVLGNGALTHARRVAGGLDESILQPEWAPDGDLYFISDRSGWWNLYRWQSGQIEPLWEMEAEFGQPQWIFGRGSYAFETACSLVCSFQQKDRTHLARLNMITLETREIATPYQDIEYVAAGPASAYVIGAAPDLPSELAWFDLDGTHKPKVICRSQAVEMDAACISIPQHIEFPTENGQTAYAYFYPPTNPAYKAPKGEKPPLLTLSHGGPTAGTTSALRMSIQFWTSRGFAVLDVDYGGSTGYGRAYRQRLNGNWGVVDVDDCANAARYLAGKGLVDGERMAISGGSAGGYTTLCALTFRQGVFRAGASYYGVSDLESLAADTHKFEARYLDRLVAPYPQGKDIYLARSPIQHTAELACPVIFFQGLDDPVVPPLQSEKMYQAVKAKGLPCAYLTFEGESHGFRNPLNRRRALEAEYYFYSRVFGFDPGDEVEAVEVENLLAAPAATPGE